MNFNEIITKYGLAKLANEYRINPDDIDPKSIYASIDVRNGDADNYAYAVLTVEGKLLNDVKVNDSLVLPKSRKLTYEGIEFSSLLVDSLFDEISEVSD